MMSSVTVQTHSRVELIDVTHQLVQVLAATGVRDGVLIAFVPHTTAAVTLNENADPSVRRDLTMALNRLIPRDLPFEHAEGNSDAHTKATLVGSSVTVPVTAGRLQLGTWQGVYFCEFDGPRQRRLLVHVLTDTRP
ncbi:MAG: YjbQ family protein [Actinobacteria bacterium]|jgi:secondary thiamine-phosphate synthase enzyme|nr:YjbQ family protein [Actinomycetota bacterium]